jgi:hypothetical protein
LRGELQRSLQKAIYLVAAGLQTTDQVTSDLLRMPVSTISMTFDPGLKWSTEQAREQYSEWILSNGFRDIIESVSAFLESAHTVVSLWAISEQSEEGAKITGEDWNRAIVTGGQRFHRLGFPDKLAHLANEHQIPCDETLGSHVLSINAARNCLVHRSGIVTERDRSSEGGLLVQWRRMVFLVKNEDGEKELVLGEVVEKDSVIAMRPQDSSKMFPLGSRVQFSAQEFCDISWCLFLFGNSLVQKINDYGLKNGFVKAEATNTKITQQGAQPDAANPAAPVS